VKLKTFWELEFICLITCVFLWRCQYFKVLLALNGVMTGELERLWIKTAVVILEGLKQTTENFSQEADILAEIWSHLPNTVLECCRHTGMVDFGLFGRSNVSAVNHTHMQAMELCLYTYNKISPLKFTINNRRPFQTALYCSRAVLYAVVDALRWSPLFRYLRAFNIVDVRAAGFL